MYIVEATNAGFHECLQESKEDVGMETIGCLTGYTYSQ